MSKRANPRETYTRGSTRQKPFDADDLAEDERWDSNIVKNIQTDDSKPRLTVDTKVSTKHINDSGTRIMITTKTRQPVKPYQSRDLRIRDSQHKILKHELRRGKLSIDSQSRGKCS